jgi:hypothetical protein
MKCIIDDISKIKYHDKTPDKKNYHTKHASGHVFLDLAPSAQHWQDGQDQTVKEAKQNFETMWRLECQVPLGHR